MFSYVKQTALVFNEFWEYQGNITLPNKPIYSVYANDEIYVSSPDNIDKFDKYLNLTLQSYPSSNNYNGIYFNESAGLLYATSTTGNRIDIFNTDLSIMQSIDTNFKPWFISQYNDMIAVSEESYTGNINFLKNNISTSNMPTSCRDRISSMLFDNYDHMIVLCYNPSYLYVYHTNGTFTGTSFRVCSSSNPLFINFDSKDRLVVVCLTKIEIYC